MSHARRLAFAASLAASFTVVACGGGGGGPSSPTEPGATSAGVLATKRGNVTVFTNGNAFDSGKAVAAIESGYDKARQQIGPAVDNIRLDGMSVTIETSVYGGGAVGQYLPASDTVEVAVGVENVIAHELQHRFCRNLGHSGDCCTYQDHNHGFDLQCRPL
ncbi:MAG TPA: hypothetical protein VGV61_00450 [Thermoanaerobaculia bacterium]|jgi:hypothetical protein|nr:hypothetical protein [Thermoanaerobaculia bacterium]